MEFVQFHPTGMVWPPGVRGLLVTEAVRGEGGILRNKDGDRFMWKYLPEDRRAEYAATDEEAGRWVTALSEGHETDARRPPELSTRDNVARAIYTEVREGRGSPHGGVFLDISYLPAENVRRKLPSMYEQFKELADVDITTRADGGRADDPLRDGRHPGRRRDRGGDRRRPVRGGRGRRRDARREPARRQLAVRPPRVRGPDGRRRGGACDGHARRARTSIPSRSRPRSRSSPRRSNGPRARSRTPSSAISRTRCSAWSASSGSRRTSTRRSRSWPTCAGAGRPSGRPAVATYNPGWNLVFELDNLLTISEAIARSARLRTESRGAHSRLDHPATDETTWGGRNSVVSRAPDGTMRVDTTALPEMTDELRGLLGPGGH